MWNERSFKIFIYIFHFYKNNNVKITYIIFQTVIQQRIIISISENFLREKQRESHCEIKTRIKKYLV